MKESVQKMNCRKKYVGESYSFYRKNRPIGKGGNGAVYEVELLSDNGLGFPMVAKFFEYEGTDKEKSGLSTLFQTNFFRLFFRYCTGV